MCAGWTIDNILARRTWLKNRRHTLRVSIVFRKSEGVVKSLLGSVCKLVGIGRHVCERKRKRWRRVAET